MTPEEFMLSVEPDLPKRRATSRLEPHRAAIQKLRAADYSLRLIQQYLEKCGVTVSHQMLSKFLRGSSPSRQRQKSDAFMPHPQPESTSGSDEVTSRRSPLTATVTKTREQLTNENPSFGKREIEQMYVDQFQSNQENPLLRRRKPV